MSLRDLEIVDDLSKYVHIQMKNEVSEYFQTIIMSKLSSLSQARVAYTCNPSYSGGKDQEDHDLKPAWANSL
jgi:hypothetical protein